LVNEHMKKPLKGLPPDPEVARQADAAFRVAADVLDRRLSASPFVAGDRLTVADFSLAAFLFHAAPARMPLAAFSAVQRWRGEIAALAAWAAAEARGRALMSRSAPVAV
jgi:glutathione S-transferase